MAEIESILRETDALIGADEFKKLVREFVSIAPEIKERRLFDVLLSQNFLFCIGDGCGLSTYLALLAREIETLGLVPLAEDPVFEVRLGTYRESAEPFESAERVLLKGDSESVRILMVDVSEWMDHADSFYFKEFLKDIDECAREFIVVFRIPFVERAVAEKMREKLCDLICIRTLYFPPFTFEEIKAFAARRIAACGYQMQRGAFEYFERRIVEERSDGKFYGLKTVEKVSKELIYEKLLLNADKKKKSSLITPSDAKRLCMRSFRGDGLSGEEMLKKFIFGEHVKAQIEEIVARIELFHRAQKGLPCIHMRFVGAPGTGKTTAARIIGKILKERGVLRIGGFYEYAGRDLCGRFIGETAPKTQSICKDAYGSVLFIDEAYSLYRGEGDGRDFGREALDTLVMEMENHRDDLVVILAGYEEEMEALMRGNRGLASRIPYTIEFKNFSREELFDIFASMAKESGAELEGEMVREAREYFLSLPEDVVSSKTFSNGRFVRNLFDRTLSKAALRNKGSRGKLTLTADDFEKAAAEKEFVFSAEKRLGF